MKILLGDRGFTSPTKGEFHKSEPWLKRDEVAILTSCSRTKEQLAERVKKVEKGVEVKKQQNNGNHSCTSPDPSLYIAGFDADLLSTR
jgi:hypothetical protein